MDGIPDLSNPSLEMNCRNRISRLLAQGFSTYSARHKEHALEKERVDTSWASCLIPIEKVGRLDDR